jgi:hypothetical protein
VPFWQNELVWKTAMKSTITALLGPAARLTKQSHSRAGSGSDAGDSGETIIAGQCPKFRADHQPAGPHE